MTAVADAPFAVLLTGNVLCNNPRVVKEADTLAQAGWRVEVLGAWITSAAIARDRQLLAGRTWTFTPVVQPSGLHRTLVSVRARMGRAVHDAISLENAWQLGYVAPELLKAARARDADIFVAHSEQAMWAAVQLADEGRTVGIDLEDWFSEDLLPEERATRPVRLLRSLEARLLASGRHSTCPSHAMSDELTREFGGRAPAVVYNAFPWADRQTVDGLRKDRIGSDRPSIHWYSQTIGPGRGLESLCSALAYVSHDADLHLRGTVAADFKEQLMALTPEGWRPRIHFHAPAANDELLSRIAEHDIGFAGETAAIRSRDLTVTNKILHYLLGGLAVVASDTAGQREIAAAASGAVRLVGDSPIEIAHGLNELLRNPDSLTRARTLALEAARDLFCWERQAPALLASYGAAMTRAVATHT